jgi:DNA-binding transcriptional regulator YhcF (GntR family)
MIRWFVDKESKVPLYLQLKDQIEYYISTGTIQADHQLPPVTALARDLGINFETVRKAYKELERYGLISMKRGQGSFITLPNSPLTPTNSKTNQKSKENGDEELMEETKSLIRRCLKNAISVAEVKNLVALAVDEVANEGSQPSVIFTECNQLQVREISQTLIRHLNLNVRPILLQDLKEELSALSPEECHAMSVITTGFHINEVRSTIGDMPIDVDVLIMNMSQETRRSLDAIGKNGKIGFICRDQESALLYKDLLKMELDNSDLELTTCTIAETDKVKNMIDSVDMLLVSPPVYEEIKRQAPPDLPVSNVFDRVDAMSLRVIKDRILGSNGHAK